MQVGVLAEELDLDGVSTLVLLPSDVKGLVNVSNEVDEESDGGREGRIARIGPEGERQLLGLDSVVLDGANDAELVGAIGGRVREVRRALGHVDVVQGT